MERSSGQRSRKNSLAKAVLLFRRQFLPNWWRGVMTGRRGPAEEGSKWAGFKAIGFYALALAGAAAVTIVLLPRAEAYGGPQAANKVIGAAINLFLIGVVALGFTKTIETMFVAKDLKRMEPQPLSGATLYLYGLPKTISYLVYASGRVLLGVLIGYGYYAVFGSGRPEQLGFVGTAGTAILYAVLMLVCCLLVLLLCTSFQAFLGSIVVSAFPPRFHQQALLATVLALTGIGALVYRAFTVDPPELSTLEQHLRTISNADEIAVVLGEFGSLIAAVFGPLLTSPGWSVPPGGWAADAMALTTAGQIVPISEAARGLLWLSLLAGGFAIVSFITGSLLFRVALEHMDPESGSHTKTPQRTSRSRTGEGAVLVSILSAMANSLPLVKGRGAVRGAFVCEILSMLRTPSRLLTIGAEVGLMPILLVSMLSSVPRLNALSTDPSTASLRELAGQGISGANLILLAPYCLVALIVGLTPLGLAHSSVGFEGERYESWAASAVSPREFLRGKWKAHVFIACSIGTFLQTFALFVIGPFFWSGFAVGLALCLILSVASSTMEIGVSARNARFDWEHPQHATSRWAILNRAGIVCRLVLWPSAVAFVVVAAVQFGLPIIPSIAVGTAVAVMLVVGVFRKVLRKGISALENMDWGGS